MFKYLQLFGELDDSEILSALSLVLSRDKSLVLLTTWRGGIRLIPCEPDTYWVIQMKDVLEPLKVKADGYTHELYGDWIPGDIYQYEELYELLEPYQIEDGLYLVCDQTRLAAELINQIRSNQQKEATDRRDVITISHLVDEKGVGYQVVIVYRCHHAEDKVAGSPESWQFNLSELGICDVPVGQGDCHLNTPEHKVMVAVQNEFWEDGTGAPQEAIRVWIKENFKDLKLGNNRKLGDSITKIEYIERFCRPRDKREGRRPKK